MNRIVLIIALLAGGQVARAQMLISFEDFDSGATGWSPAFGGTFDANQTSNFAGATILGGRERKVVILEGREIVTHGFSTHDVEKTFDLSGVPHTSVEITFDLYSIDSWDCGADHWGKDSWMVNVDGTMEYTLCRHQDTTFPDIDGIVDVDLGEGFWDDRIVKDITLDIPHTGNSLTFQVESRLNQHPTDESWGIDNLRITAVQGQAGDINGDGDVDFRDFLILSANFGKSGTLLEGDLDGDGSIAFADFLLLSANFGKKNAAVNVPEPSDYFQSVTVLAFVLVLAYHWKRRYATRTS